MSFSDLSRDVFKTRALEISLDNLSLGYPARGIKLFGLSKKRILSSSTSQVSGRYERFEHLKSGDVPNPQSLAVQGLSGSFVSGSLTAIVGANGAGKSTLIKALAGQIKPMAGRILGIDNQRVAYLPQHATLDKFFPVRVDEFTAMGLWHECGAFRGFSNQQMKRVYEALECVGLGNYFSRTIDTLSGGQVQRMLFARMMLQDAGVLLLDEPFSAIDQHTSADLMRLLTLWSAEGKSIIAVLHDWAMVSHSFPQTLMLSNRLVAWGNTKEVFTLENIEKLGKA